MAEYRDFGYDCPLKCACSVFGPHQHRICPKCGCPEYFNLICDECRRLLELDGRFPEVVATMYHVQRVMRMIYGKDAVQDGQAIPWFTVEH